MSTGFADACLARGAKILRAGAIGARGGGLGVGGGSGDGTVGGGSGDGTVGLAAVDVPPNTKSRFWLEKLLLLLLLLLF